MSRFYELTIDDKNKPLWRYISLDKFFKLLKSNQIYFPRADKLGDTTEGMYVPQIFENLSRIGKNFFRNSFKPLAGYVSLFSYISCWNMDNNENFSLWKAFGGNKQSVCIKTKPFKEIEEYFENTIIGKIKYLPGNIEKCFSIYQGTEGEITEEAKRNNIEDIGRIFGDDIKTEFIEYIEFIKNYPTKSPRDIPSIIYSFFCKRKYFSNEQEVRIIYYDEDKEGSFKSNMVLKDRTFYESCITIKLILEKLGKLNLKDKEEYILDIKCIINMIDSYPYLKRKERLEGIKKYIDSYRSLITKECSLTMDLIKDMDFIEKIINYNCIFFICKTILILEDAKNKLNYLAAEEDMREETINSLIKQLEEVTINNSEIKGITKDHYLLPEKNGQKELRDIIDKIIIHPQADISFKEMIKELVINSPLKGIEVISSELEGTVPHSAE